MLFRSRADGGVLADAGSIPAISTNTKGQPFFRLAFFIGGDGRVRTHISSSKNSSGTNFNACCLRSPERVRKIFTPCNIHCSIFHGDFYTNLDENSTIAKEPLIEPIFYPYNFLSATDYCHVNILRN